MIVTDLTSDHIDAVREGLGMLSDVILPGTDRLPSGRAVGAHADALDLVLRADPSLEGPVIRAGRRAIDSAADLTLGQLEGWDPADRDPVTFALTAAYYTCRPVWTALDYPGPGTRPAPVMAGEERYPKELLAPVIERGEIYVRTED